MRNLCSKAAIAVLLGTLAFSGQALADGDTTAISDAKSAADSLAINGSGGIQGQTSIIDQRFEGSVTNIPDPAAYAPDASAPGLTTSYANTCHGSSSGGFSFGNGAVALGASGGSTWQDDECEARMDAAAIRALGPQYHVAAQARLCQMTKIRAAMKLVKSTQCPQDSLEGAAAKKAALRWLQQDGHQPLLQPASFKSSKAIRPTHCSWGGAEKVFRDCVVPASVAMLPTTN